MKKKNNIIMTTPKLPTFVPLIDNDIQPYQQSLIFAWDRAEFINKENNEFTYKYIVL